MIDSGMDTSGVEAALALLKKMARERSKSIWLVSHKDELAGRVNNLFKVVKENGFTSYSTDIDIMCINVYMTWFYQDKEVMDIPEDSIGFVYLITNLTNNRKYIGKKTCTV